MRAGQAPNPMPTSALKPTATATVETEMVDAQPRWRRRERSAEAEPEADDSADEGEHDGFDDELGEDVSSFGADGPADADLVGPLADRHQHDVHDANSADHQADRCDATEQQGQGLLTLSKVLSNDDWLVTVKRASSSALRE